MKAPPAFPSSALLQWFSQQSRDLPWREGYDPYQVLLSEMMLQQTQIATALPYFHRWVERWPNWSALAAASEEEVLKAWEGLGYYQRARRLLELAKTVDEDHGGLLPSDEKQLGALPGLGPYTVAAVSSIAFNQAAFPIDGNVRRVLSRFYANSELSPSKTQDSFFQSQLLPVFKRVLRRRELAQAIMELGALVCRPKTPLCEVCPLQKDCSCAHPSRAKSFPVKKAKAKAKVLHLAFIWGIQDHKIPLRKRSSKGRFPSQYEPPSSESSDEDMAKMEAAKLLGVPSEEVQWKPSFRRDFTTYHVFWHEGFCEQPNLETHCDGTFKWYNLKKAQQMSLVPVMAKKLSLSHP